MPSAERLPSGKWRAIWRLPNGRKKSLADFITRKAAITYAIEQEDAPPPSELTWAEWEPRWLALRVVEASTSDTDLHNVNKWVRPHWGETALEDITRQGVQLWVNSLAKQVAPGTVARIYHALSASLNAAVDSGVLPLSPCSRIKLPKVSPGTERYFTRAEIDAALAEMVNPYRAMVALLVGTGLRYGEAAGLHWQRLDLERGLLQVVETYSDRAGGIKAYPKGIKIRSVPVPDWVLSELPTRSSALACGVPHLSHGAACRSGLVLPATGGGPMDAHNMRARHWLPALRAAGIEHARQHDLRHTYASWLLQDGVSLEDLAEVLGHSQVTVTKRYSHMAGAHLTRVAAVIATKGPVPQPSHGPGLRLVPKALSGP